MALSAWAMALSKRSSPKQISLFPSEAAGVSAAPAKPLPSYLKDHRKRLRERFDRAGLAAMPDYELLELVLFRALRRKDVKPLARSLLERFWVLFLDRKNVLIRQEQQSEGTVDHLPVYQREILKRALQLNASVLILVHNHPSGNP